MGVSLATATINTGGRDRIKVEDLFDMVQWPNQEFRTLRPIGEISALATHWIGIVTKEGKKTNLGKTCSNVKLDGTTDPNGGCPYCKVGHSPRTGYFQNVIDIDEEENAPRKQAPPTPEEKKLGFKLKGTKLYTPVRVLVFPPTVAETMQKLTKKNKDKTGKMRELADPTFGRALDISRDTRDGVSPANMWNVQKADQTMRKLTEDQRDYYLWNLGLLRTMVPKAKAAEAELKQLILIMQEEELEKLDLEAYPDMLAKRNGGKATKKSKSGGFQAEDEDDDEAPKKRRRVVDEDEDDDDDLPPRKSSKKKKKKSFNIESVF